MFFVPFKIQSQGETVDLLHFISLPLFFMTLVALGNAGQVFYRTCLHLEVSVVSA